MKRISDKKFSLTIVLATLLTVFAMFTALTFNGFADNSANGVFADEVKEETTLLKTKAKISLDKKYLLLVTGFDSATLNENGLYYIGYRYNFNGEVVDTARILGTASAKYYSTITLKTNLEDESETQVVTPAMIYGEDYADYKLIVYEIEFETSFGDDFTNYSDLYAYIEEVEKNEETGNYDVIASSQGDHFTYADRDKYFPENNDFEKGVITGWTITNLVENQTIGGVIKQDKYWKEKISFDKNGDYLFSAYTKGGDDEYVTDGDEGAKGTLTSSKFTLGGSGWITFKFGGAKHYEQVYFDVVEYGTDKVLARYYNSEWTDEDKKGCALNQYKANLSEYLNKDMYIRITDNATADYGLFFVDDIITYYSTEPDIGVEAVNVLNNPEVLNGSFDKNFNGWILEGDIGVITDLNTFWDNPTRPINNDGKYFRGDLDEKEGRTGTLTSSDFVVSGSGFITFKLGAAGNENCYITLEKKTENGYEKVALWHNNEWVDGAGNEEKPGYGLRMVDYKADLSAYLDETMRIVLCDNATGGFGFFTFDELKTNYKTEPVGTLMENQLTAMANLRKALNDDNVASLGDYTEESYEEYLAKRNTAEGLSNYSKISTINSVLQQFVTAYEGLTLRVSEEVEGSVKLLRAYAGNTLELTLSDYVNENNLSGISYEVLSSDTDSVMVGEIENGKVTLTAQDVSDKTATITVNVKYNGETKLSVVITVTVTKDQTPSLLAESVDKTLDIYALENKTGYEINFAANVENPGNLNLTYSVTQDGQKIELNNNAYTFVFDNYTYKYTDVVFAVKAGYTANGENAELTYNYSLHINDTTNYRLKNGDFEDGLTGWTISDTENPFGHVTEASEWFDNITYNKDGIRLFSGIEDFINGRKEGNGVEGNVGTLTSGSFTIGGLGYMSFKLGGGNAYCYVSVVEESTGNVLAKYYNNNRSINPGTMVQYYVDLSDHIGKKVYIQVVDNAVNDWGCIAFDSMVVYYADISDIPEGAVYNENGIYQVVNGSFEMGLSGWSMVLTENGEYGTLGRVVNNEIPEGWYQINDFRKDGNSLFTFYFYDGDRKLNSEKSKGSLRSSEFILKTNGIISFRFGAAHNEGVYINVRTSDGTILATFRNSAHNTVNATEMVYYYYQFDNKEDISCYFEIVDDATDNYGCFVVDDFRTNIKAVPDDAVKAQDVKPL